MTRNEILEWADSSLSKLKYKSQPFWVSVMNIPNKDKSFYDETNMTRYSIVPSGTVQIPDGLDYGAGIAMISHNSHNVGLPPHLHLPRTSKDTFTIFKKLHGGSSRARVVFYDYDADLYRGGFVRADNKPVKRELILEDNLIMQFNSSELLHEMIADSDSDIWLLYILEGCNSDVETIKEKFECQNLIHVN